MTDRRRFRHALRRPVLGVATVLVLAAGAVVPAAASGGDTTPPTVSIDAPAQGGTLSGTRLMRATAADKVGVVGVQFLVDGQVAGTEKTHSPYSRTWNTARLRNGTHKVSAVARDAAGNTTRATPVTVTVANAPTLDTSTPAATAVERNVRSTTSPAFSPPGRAVLYAVFSMDSASYTGTVTTVSSVSNTGTPLTWRLLGRENSHNSSVGGFVEVWWTYNPTAQTGITATGTFSQNTKNVPSPVGDFQVLVLDAAAADQSSAAWRSNAFIGARNSAPAATLDTDTANTRVFAVFDDWDSAARPTPAADQTIQSIVLNATDVDGYWVQQKTTTVAAPSTVQLSATISDTSQWHALAWEVKPAV